MKLHRLACSASLLAALALVAPEAGAETKAEELFQQGLELFEAGQLGQACERFAESQELEPRVGTALNLARCEEQRGHLASALAAWQAAATLAAESGDERRQLAEERATQIDPTVPRLTLVAPEGAPEGTVYKLLPPQGNPREVVPSAGEVRVDTGVTTVVVAAPGHVDRSTEITLAQGQRESLQLQLGEALGGDGVTPATGGEGGLHPLELTGYIVGGVGLVGLGIGAALGVVAKSKLDESNEKGCDEGGTLCDDDVGVGLRDDALGMATGSTVSFVLGGVLTAAGVVLVLVAPSSGSDTEVALAPTPTGLTLSGRF